MKMTNRIENNNDKDHPPPIESQIFRNIIFTLHQPQADLLRQLCTMIRNLLVFLNNLAPSARMPHHLIFRRVDDGGTCLIKSNKLCQSCMGICTKWRIKLKDVSVFSMTCFFLHSLPLSISLSVVISAPDIAFLPLQMIPAKKRLLKISMGSWTVTIDVGWYKIEEVNDRNCFRTFKIGSIMHEI